MNTTSKSFLFTTWEGGGNIGPVITVARKLLERGHRVRLMSDLANRSDAEAAGLEFSPWREAPSRADRTPGSCPIRDWEAADPAEGIQWVLDRVIFGPALEYARDVVAELEREPVDLVVTSEMLPGVLVACEARGQRSAIFAANLCIYPIPGMPVFGPGVPPPRTPEDEAMHEEIRRGGAAMFDRGLDGLNRARLAFGLMPLASTVDQVRNVDPFLMAASRAFDFPSDPPANFHYVGPQLGEPAWAGPWKSPWPASDARPLVAVGFSTTYQAHERVLQNVIDATAALPVRTLVTLGQVEPDAVRAAENTVLVHSAPHNAVMREAAVVVTHGGHGTVMRALSHRRPMLVIPHGRDQEDNAARVTERGAGIKLAPTASVAELEAAIRRLLNEPSFADAAKALGDAIAADSKEDRVVPLLEEAAIRGSCVAA